MTSLPSRNFLTAALPFLSEDSAPAATFAALCATSSANMNGSFVPEFAAKNDLNSETDPIFKLINDFSSTLQWTTRLNLSEPKAVGPGALLQNQIQTKRYFSRQLTSLECFPNSTNDYRIFLEKCLPHLRALRKLSFKTKELKYTFDGFKIDSKKTHVAALVPLVNLEDLSIDGSLSSDMWLSDIWKQNPMPHLRKLTVVGGEKNCYLDCISSRLHAERLEVLDLTLNFPVYSQPYCRIFGKSWSVPDLRELVDLRELYLRGTSILEEAVVDCLLGYKNRQLYRVSKEDDFEEGSGMHYFHRVDIVCHGKFALYEGDHHERRFVRKFKERVFYAEAHQPWYPRNVRPPPRNTKVSLEDETQYNDDVDDDDDDDDDINSNTSRDSDTESNSSSSSSSTSSVASSVVSLSDKVGICKKLRKLHLSGRFFLRSHAGEVYRIINEIGSTWVTELDLNGLRFNNSEYQKRADVDDIDTYRNQWLSIHFDDRVMAFAVKKFPHLRELNLQKFRHLGDDTLFAIGKHCSSLTKLRLPYWGYVTDEGIAALFDPKKSNNTFRSLEELAVGGENIIQEWAEGDDGEISELSWDVEYDGAVAGQNWFGSSIVLTEKMSYRLKKLDCSELERMCLLGLVQIMNAFSHCLEEFIMPTATSFQILHEIEKFPVMKKLKSVTNLPLNVLGFPNVGSFIRSCPVLQNLSVGCCFDLEEHHPEELQEQWTSFETQQPSLKEMRRLPHEDDGDHFDDDYCGPSLDEYLVEVANILREIDDNNDTDQFKRIEFGLANICGRYGVRNISAETWNVFAEIKSLTQVKNGGYDRRQRDRYNFDQIWSLAQRRPDINICDANGNTCNIVIPKIGKR